MTKDELFTNINNNFKNINHNWLNLIEKYRLHLTECNKQTNLTRLDDESKIYGSYFFDSVIPYKDIDFLKINSVLDIGSGSGIPGIVLKILYPHIKLHIIESNNKKVTFLNSLIKELNLTDVKVFLKRAEIINESEYETYDLVTSRAVGRLKAMLEVSVPYAKVNGLIVIPKSINYLQEAKELEQLQQKLSVKCNLNSFVSIVGTTHNVFTFIKTKKTNRVYPRPWSKIVKDA